AFLVMGSSVDGANVLAGRRLAMLAEHWLGNHLRVIDPLLELLLLFAMERVQKIRARLLASFFGQGPPRIVAIDAQPVHFTASLDLVFSNDRHVVLTLAGQHASRT